MKTEINVPVEIIEKRIFIIRGLKVILDKDLAELYGVETFNLNKAVKRNLDRFPSDFMFRLTGREFKNLIFHFGISSWGGTRKLPYAFTEQGIAMLSSVLNSERAVKVNIQIMRAFVHIREYLSSHKELAQKIKELEEKYSTHDEKIHLIFEAIKQLIEPPEVESKLKPQIGFKVGEPRIRYKIKQK